VGALRVAVSKGRFSGPAARKALFKAALELKTGVGIHHSHIIGGIGGRIDRA
jgi:hypothetical protein